MAKNFIDFRKLLESNRFGKIAREISTGISSGLHGYFGTYEKKVKSLVKEIDLKSRDAREKSKDQLDKFTEKLKNRKSDLEKRVVGLVNVEAEKLNKGLTELVSYLKTLSHEEKNNVVKKVRQAAKKSVAKKRNISPKVQETSSSQNVETSQPSA